MEECSLPWKGEKGCLTARLRDESTAPVHAKEEEEDVMYVCVWISVSLCVCVWERENLLSLSSDLLPLVYTFARFIGLLLISSLIHSEGGWQPFSFGHFYSGHSEEIKWNITLAITPRTGGSGRVFWYLVIFVWGIWAFGIEVLGVFTGVLVIWYWGIWVFGIEVLGVIFFKLKLFLKDIFIKFK